VSFLRDRQRLTESEALARGSRTDLAALSQLSPAELSSVKGPRVGLALTVGLSLGAFASLTQERWSPWVQQLVEQVRRG
jgi:hypothetical protein